MRYAGLELNDIGNGEGIGVSIWFQGCPHHCPGCFNPETWSFDEGMIFAQEDLNKILDGLQANGITRNFNILGGEPMCEENLFLTNLLCAEVKNRSPESKIYIWTGYTIEELLNMSNPKVRNILQIADVLIDGRFIQEEKDLTLKMRGSKNQRIIDLKKLTF